MVRFPDRLFDPGKGGFNQPFRLAVFDRYWTRLLLEEFFACVHSGKAAPDDVFREIVSQKKRAVESFLEYLSECLTAFWRKETDAQDVKVNVAVMYWRVLVEQAMLFGVAIGRGSDLAAVPSVWPQPNGKSKLEIVRPAPRGRFEAAPAF